MELLRQHHISFRHAFDGLKWAFSTQPNFRVHFFFAFTALILGFILKITFTEMTILILTIVFGLGVEMVNTAIESMTDLITNKYHQQAKIAKDVAAGMMLLAAMGTFLVGAIILLPKIIPFFL